MPAFKAIIFVPPRLDHNAENYLFGVSKKSTAKRKAPEFNNARKDGSLSSNSSSIQDLVDAGVNAYGGRAAMFLLRKANNLSREWYIVPIEQAKNEKSLFSLLNPYHRKPTGAGN